MLSQNQHFKESTTMNQSLASFVNALGVNADLRRQFSANRTACAKQAGLTPEAVSLVGSSTNSEILAKINEKSEAFIAVAVAVVAPIVTPETSVGIH